MSGKDQGHIADDEEPPELIRRPGRSRRGRPRGGRRYRGRIVGSPGTRMRATEENRRQYSTTIRVEKPIYDKLVTIKNQKHKTTIGDTLHFLIERYEIHQAVSNPPLHYMPQLASTPIQMAPAPVEEWQETPVPLSPRELFPGTSSGQPSIISLAQPIISYESNPSPITAGQVSTNNKPPSSVVESDQERQSETHTQSETQMQELRESNAAWNILLPPQDILDETIPYGKDLEDDEDSDEYSSNTSSFLDTSTVSSLYEPSPPNSTDSEAMEEAIDQYLQHVGFVMNSDRKDLKGIEPESGREEEVHEDLSDDSAPESSVDEFSPISSASEVMADKSTLAYTSCLKKLAHLKVPQKCNKKGCSAAVSLEVTQTGSAIYFIWICQGESRHVITKWCSQPRFKYGQHLGDFQICAGTLFSGNNFSKVSVFCEAFNMKPPSESTYMRVQRNYAIPAVDDRWREVNEEVLERMNQRESIVILGDGRMDSPGFNAQYCTYTFLDNESKDIISMVVVDKREVEGVSVNMEKFGFIKGLEGLKDRGITVEEVVTDAHTQITALMKRQYADIHHSYDVWHGAKNLAKKIIAAAAEKDCGILLQWVQDISNHFWYCAKVAVNYVDFMAKWRGLLHHVCGNHEWLPLEGYDDGKCGHGDLEAPDKELFVSGSKAHDKLRHLIMDTYFLGRIEKYLNFRSTSELESFNNKILSFASKRFFFHYPGYRARCMLAGLDYQENKTNMPLTNKQGEPLLRRVFRKRSGRWDVISTKERTFEYVKIVMEMSIMDRIQNPEKLRLRAILSDDDPRRLASHSAKVAPPPTKDIYAAKRSRKDTD